MDTILQFHNDLATLPKSDIYVLASFYDLSGSLTDLLWLIAIKHYYSYNKAELKGAQLEFAEKLPDLIKAGKEDASFPSFTDDFLEKLDKLIKDKKEIRKTKDIDEKKRLGATIKQDEKEIENDSEWVGVMTLKQRFEHPQYYSWILQSYLNGSIDNLEAINSDLIPAIEDYKFLEKNGIKHDKKITELNGLTELKTYLDKYNDEIRRLKGEKEAADRELEKIRSEAPTIYDGEKVIIKQPKTEAAACYYGRFTKWCTAGKEDNQFDFYNEQGPMYIIIPKDPDYKGEKYQFHEASEQYVNEKDKKFDLIKFMDRYKPDMAKIDELTDFYNKNGFHILRTAIKQNRNNLIDKYEKYATGEVFYSILKAGRDDLIDRFEKYADAEALLAAIDNKRDDLIDRFEKYANVSALLVAIENKRDDLIDRFEKYANRTVINAVIEDKRDDLIDRFEKYADVSTLFVVIYEGRDDLIERFEKHATGEVFCAIFEMDRNDLIERFEKYMDSDGLMCAVYHDKFKLFFKHLKYLNTDIINELIDRNKIDILSHLLKEKFYEIEPAVIEKAFTKCDLKLIKTIIDNVDLQNEEIVKKIFDLTVWLYEYCEDEDKDILNYLLSLDYRIPTYIDDFKEVVLNSEFTPSDVSKLWAKITVNPADEETLIKDIINGINYPGFRKNSALHLDERLNIITDFLKSSHYEDFLQAVKNIYTTANIEPLKQVQFSEKEVTALIILSMLLDKWEIYKYLLENNDIYTDIWRLGYHIRNPWETINPDQKYADLFLQKVREVVSKLDSDTVAKIINALPEREQKIALNDPIIKPRIILDKLDLAPEYINELLQDT